MSAEQEQDTAAKSGKKLSALLVMGGVIIIGGIIPFLIVSGIGIQSPGQTGDKRLVIT